MYTVHVASTSDVCASIYEYTCALVSGDVACIAYKVEKRSVCSVFFANLQEGNLRLHCGAN